MGGSGPLRDEEINNLITVAEQTYNTFLNVSGNVAAPGASWSARLVYFRKRFAVGRIPVIRLARDAPHTATWQ